MDGSSHDGVSEDILGSRNRLHTERMIVVGTEANGYQDPHSWNYLVAEVVAVFHVYFDQGKKGASNPSTTPNINHCLYDI